MEVKVEKRSGLLLGWCAALVVGTALFHSLGSGVLAAPPVSPSGWSEWAAGREPTVVGIALLRLVTLGLCWYLVGVTTVGLVARLLRAARLIRIADALTVPWVRRLLQQGLGIALATAMVTSAAGAAPAGGVRLSGASPPSATMTLAAATPDVTAPPRDIATPPLAPPWTAAVPAPRPDPQPQAGTSEVPVLWPDRQPWAETSVAADGAELQLPWELFADAGEGSEAATVPQAPGVVEVPGAVEVPRAGQVPGAVGVPRAGQVPAAVGVPRAGQVPGAVDVPLPIDIASSAQVPTPGAVGNGPDGAERETVSASGADTQVDLRSGAAGSSEPTTQRHGGSYTVRAGDSLWRIAEQQLARELERTPSSAEVVPYWRAVIEANQSSLPDPDDPDLILPGQRLSVPPLLPLHTR